jgi:hypothetical protein
VNKPLSGKPLTNTPPSSADSPDDVPSFLDRLRRKK